MLLQFIEILNSNFCLCARSTLHVPHTPIRVRRCLPQCFERAMCPPLDARRLLSLLFTIPSAHPIAIAVFTTAPLARRAFKYSLTWYFIRQWTPRIRQNTVSRMHLEVPVESHSPSVGSYTISLLQGHEPAERANWNTLLPVIHIYIGAYTKIFASKIFEVGGRSSKNTKI